MHETIPKHFGLTIAFLVPGLLGLYALSFLAPPIADWLGLAARQETNLGGFLFALIASVGIGVFISGLRCLTIDWVMPKRPDADYAKLADPNNERVLEFARVHHYQFYQFYSNTLCALVLVFGAWLWTAQPWPDLWAVGGRLVLLVAVCAVLFLSARDCLTKYIERTGPCMSPSPAVHSA